MLASDDANPAFVGARNPDDALVVHFYNRPVEQPFESSKAGRPIYRDVIYVRIDVPGLKEMQVDIPARDDHQRRFPRQWAHFQQRTQGDAREVGTPLTEWPVLTRSQAEELRGLKFFTVESLANASDAAMQNIGMLGGMAVHTLRDKARAFLTAATNSALPQHQAQELAKANAEISMLKEQMAALAANVAKPAPAPQSVATSPTKPIPDVQPVVEQKKKRGRPSKAELAARAAQPAST